MSLSRKQQRFVQEYLVDLNATAAYKRAGYRANGHSAESAASLLLSNIEVKTAIAEACEVQKQRTQVTADKWVDSLWKCRPKSAKATVPQIKAMELLAKHFGWIEERSKQVPPDAPVPADRLASFRKRYAHEDAAPPVGTNGTLQSPHPGR